MLLSPFQTVGFVESGAAVGSKTGTLHSVVKMEIPQASVLDF
jgi:hypothetical protein